MRALTSVLSATVDTNLYISALQFDGLPLRLLELAAAGEVRLDVSDAILAEIKSVLRNKFGWQEADLHDVELNITSYADRVTSTQTLSIITADPSDNRILECAVAAHSDYIVTGDKRHILPLGSYDGIPILMLAQFLERAQVQ